MFEKLESTTDLSVAVDSVQYLMFKNKASPNAISTSLDIASRYFEPNNLIESAAKNTLPTLYHKHNSKIHMPPILHSWKGDFREGTEEIYNIAKGKKRNKDVELYQQKMRSKLPSKIPLVRGSTTTKNQNRVLRSWTASVGTARIYGDTILYTVVSPDDVFMCSLYGDNIGEQEFTLQNYTIEKSYKSSIENHIKIYQKMHKLF